MKSSISPRLNFVIFEKHMNKEDRLQIFKKKQQVIDEEKRTGSAHACLLQHYCQNLTKRELWFSKHPFVFSKQIQHEALLRQIRAKLYITDLSSLPTEKSCNEMLLRIGGFVVAVVVVVFKVETREMAQWVRVLALLT